MNLTQGRTIYRPLQYLPPGTPEQQGPVLHKAGQEQLVHSQPRRLKPGLVLQWASTWPGGEEAAGLLLKARSEWWEMWVCREQLGGFISFFFFPLWGLLFVMF